MSLPDAPPLNTGAILKALIDHQVEFVLVGGIASDGHGSTRLTKDLDVCPDWTDANLDRIAAALRDLDAKLKIGEGSTDLIAAETGFSTASGGWRDATDD